MQAILLEKNSDSDTATIDINRRRLIVRDRLGESTNGVGKIIDIELRIGALYEQDCLNAMLFGNKGAIKSLSSTGGWSYRAFGRVEEKNDKKFIDIGFTILELPLAEAHAGMYLSVGISQLDAYLK